MVLPLTRPVIGLLISRGASRCNGAAGTSPGCQQSRSHRLRPAADGDDAGARHLDQAERQHQVDERSILSVAPVISKTKLSVRGVDDAGAEDVGQAQRLDPLLALAAHLDQRQLALDRAGRPASGRRRGGPAPGGRAGS